MWNNGFTLVPWYSESVREVEEKKKAEERKAGIDDDWDFSAISDDSNSDLSEYEEDGDVEAGDTELGPEKPDPDLPGTSVSSSWNLFAHDCNSSADNSSRSRLPVIYFLIFLPFRVHLMLRDVFVVQRHEDEIIFFQIFLIPRFINLAAWGVPG